MLCLIILSLTGVSTMFLGFMKTKKLVLPVATLGVVLALAALWSEQSFWNYYLSGMVQTEGIARLLSVFILLNGLFVLPFFNLFTNRGNEELGDFISLIVFSLMGAVLMVSSVNYMSLFIGLEILSIAMYILAGADRKRVKSNEASLKYFITGAFTSAILLFGIGLLYAGTGSLEIQNQSAASHYLEQFAYVFLFTAFALKVAVVPFHFWAPDVYEGTPTLFTATMASMVKVASIGAFLRIIQLNAEVLPEWTQWYFAFLILASLLFGNILALNQRSTKRLLAYSGIVQAGFILMAFIQFEPGSEVPVLYYFMAYVLASVVCFVVIHFVEEQSGTDDIDSFAGLAKSNPVLAVTMTIALISLAGGPLTSGFVAKIYMLMNAIDHGFASLVVVAVVCTLLSVYYYYKIINAMYSGSADQKWNIHWSYQLVLLLATIITLIAGIVPSVFTSSI